MCRFLMVRAKNQIDIRKLLEDFAEMCKVSHEYQGDGWGIAWLDRDTKWELSKSINPIWEEKQSFNKIPTSSNQYVVHARSASFDDQKGTIDHNQPYLYGNIAFVSNLFLKGVKIGRRVKGSIGAQKIFNLIKEFRSTDLDKTVREIRDLVVSNTKEVKGLNIGISDGNRFYVTCNFRDDKDYFSVRYFKDQNITLVCSKPIGNFDWKTMENEEILTL